MWVIEEFTRTNAGMSRAGGIRSNSQDSSTGADPDVHHAVKAVMRDGAHGATNASRGTSCRRMFPGRSMITVSDFNYVL